MTTTSEANEEIRKRECPTCQAKAGAPCTQPTDTGRRAVNWWHLSRRFPCS